MPVGLTPELIARLTRHGSPDAAFEKARRDPRFAQDLDRVVSQLQSIPVKCDDWYRLDAERWDLVAAWDLLVGEEVNGSGALLPRSLIEKALRKHVRDGCGRRTLGQIPGLTEWTARQLLGWFDVGEPDGLWLDDRGRVQVGAKLAPTPDGVRLPRI